MKKIVIIGNPIKHSLSPIMWNTAFKALGLGNEFIYEALDVNNNEIPIFINKLRDRQFFGVNVTIPYKTLCIKYLDRLTENAQLIGAVNTIYLDRGNLVGDNTDGMGCLSAIRENGIDIKGKRLLILGAGGAARAIVFSLIKEGVNDIIILNRTKSKAEVLTHEIYEKLGVDLLADDLSIVNEIVRDVDMVINCTSIGMLGESSERSIITKEMLKSDHIVMDIVYNPPMTALFKETKEAGATIINGIDMLIYQAVINFKRWTKKDAPIDIMKKILIKTLCKKSI